MTFKCLELLLMAGSDFMSLFKRFFIIFCLFLVSQFCIFAGGRKTDSGKKGKLDFIKFFSGNSNARIIAIETTPFIDGYKTQGREF